MAMGSAGGRKRSVVLRWVRVVRVGGGRAAALCGRWGRFRASRPGALGVPGRPRRGSGCRPGWRAPGSLQGEEGVRDGDEGYVMVEAAVGAALEVVDRRSIEVRRISAASAKPDATPGPLTREGVCQECPRSAQMMAAVADATVTASRIARQARAKRRSVSSKARRSSSSSRRLLLAVRAIARSTRSGVREHTVDDVGNLGGHHVAGFLATAVPLGNPGLLVTVAVL
jgi:hypothetical protein